MSIFNVFSGKNKNYLSEKQHLKNLQSQLNMTPETVEQLRKLGVTEEKALKLEFFFYTNSSKNAETLANELTEKGYSAEFGLSADGNKIQIVTGWTVPIVIKKFKVLEWTREMCLLGYKHDCEFDGWGTNTEQ